MPGLRDRGLTLIQQIWFTDSFYKEQDYDNSFAFVTRAAVYAGNCHFEGACR
jgi:hypothetical protein